MAADRVQPENDVKPHRGGPRRPVVCLETGESYESVPAAAKAKGLKDVLGVHACLEGKRRTAGGYHWALKGSGSSIERIEAGRKLKRWEAGRVVCLETGDVYESVPAAAAAIELKSSSGIYGCLHGIARTAGGYHWAFEGSDLTIEQIEVGRNTRRVACLEAGRMRNRTGAKRVVCLETGEVYESAYAAAKAVFISSSSSIVGCLKGKQRTAGGFHWAFADGDPD